MKKFSTLLFFCLTCFFGYSQALTDSLLIQYQMNGNAIDNSGNGFDGIVNATPTTDRFGNANGAFYFDGIDDYIDLPNDPALKPDLPITIAFWANVTPSSPSPINEFVSTDFQQNNYHGCWVSGGSSGVGVGFGGGLGNTGPDNRRSKGGAGNLTPNTWFHVAVVVRGANDMDIYIDCVNAGGTYSGTGPTSIAYSNTPGSIGRMDANTTVPAYYFNGSMDDFRYWNRGLSASEITTLCSGITEVDELVAKEKIQIYPNPTENVITIESALKLVDAAIIDITGKVVLKGAFNNKVSVDELVSGVYFLKLTEKNETVHYVKFIKS
jgi:hypothetical protein